MIKEISPLGVLGVEYKWGNQRILFFRNKTTFVIVFPHAGADALLRKENQRLKELLNEVQAELCLTAADYIRFTAIRKDMTREAKKLVSKRRRMIQKQKEQKWRKDA